MCARSWSTPDDAYSANFSKQPAVLLASHLSPKIDCLTPSNAAHLPQSFVARNEGMSVLVLRPNCDRVSAHGVGTRQSRCPLFASVHCDPLAILTMSAPNDENKPSTQPQSTCKRDQLVARGADCTKMRARMSARNLTVSAKDQQTTLAYGNCTIEPLPRPTKRWSKAGIAVSTRSRSSCAIASHRVAGADLVAGGPLFRGNYCIHYRVVQAHAA